MKPSSVFAFMCVHSRLFFGLCVADAARPPAAHTGGFGEPNCTRCHTGSVNPSEGRIVLTAPAVYSPGMQFPVQVSIADPTGLRWGFELSARFANGTQAGTLAAGAANVDVVTANSIQYARQAIPNALTFTVNWTAPPDTTRGEVIFHAAGLAANNDGQTSGDRTYVTEVRAAAGAPSVPAGGVVNGASFSPAPNNAASPGQIVSIFGTNLAVGGPYGATALPLPVRLGTTAVRFGTRDMPLFYVSSSQINAQIPPEEGSAGARNVTVVQGTVMSAEVPVQMAATAPGVFTIPPGGAGRGAILHADFTPVDATKPAASGEVVLIFCTGLGQTNPAGFVSSAVSVTVGGQPARVDFAGLAPGFVGLYQINAAVPAVSGGDHAIVVTAGAASSQNGVTMAVR
jgi:uncharacterized protein (TIGR03437 family)